MVDDPTGRLAIALGYAARGWHIFPLRPNDKRPAFPDHSAERCTGRDLRCRAAGTHVGWEARASTDRERITRAWSAAPYNIGIACGPSCLVVVDLDTPKPGQVPPEHDPPVANGADVYGWIAARHTDLDNTFSTYTVRTGRGGYHLYLHHPDSGPSLRNTAGQLGWLIDTRAHGGYVVAAGSVVNGRPYTVTRDADLLPLPEWLTQLLRPAPLPPQQPVTVTLRPGRDRAYLDVATRRNLDAVATAPDGALNRTLYGASVALGQLIAGGALDPDATENALVSTAMAAGHPPGGARRTVRSGFRAGAHRPRTPRSTAA